MKISIMECHVMVLLPLAPFGLLSMVVSLFLVPLKGGR